MCRIFTCVLTFMLFFTGFQLLATGNGSIEGVIKDHAGQAIVGANVLLEGSQRGGVTNAQGYFKIPDLVPGTYNIKITSIGYVSSYQEVDVKPGNSAVVNINLVENIYQLPGIVIERETMTGGSQFVNDIPGSAHFISTRELQKFAYTDINRILRNIPGINIQEEEGFGLRPNIGMRGTGVERSSKITLMEDGILAAPAPYTAPAAYYFPTVGRMRGVEVRKGSSQIKYGPYTTGGAINFLSIPIPQEFSVNMSLLAGNFGRRVAHLSMGHSFKYGGFVLETFQNSATGFKQLDTGGPTGFNSEDFLAKIRINTPGDAKVHQSLTFKIAQAMGDSDETYLGLTDDDFKRTPYRRYSASQVDNIRTDHKQLSVKYNIIPASFMDVSLTAYHNEFSRNWYKLDAVRHGSSKISISTVLDDHLTYQNEYDILTGLVTGPTDNALNVKANNRNYYARGIQAVTGFNFESRAIKHDIETGIRYHKDEEDRYQWEDVYEMENNIMKLTQAGIRGTDSNRLSDAAAFASYIQYTFKYGGFTALPGVRYENITLSRSDYGKNDPGRTGAGRRDNENKVHIWIPGIGLEYDFTNTFHSFFGIHRGFAPPGSTEGTRPEKSINYEAGARLNNARITTQAVLFFNDYQNLLGSDLAASGGAGTGDQFNAGQAEIYGAEFELTYNLLSSITKGIAVPLRMAYTYTDGKFESTFQAVNEDWGKVQKGDHLPYISNHQLTLNVGLEHSRFDINVSSKYVSAMRTAPGKGTMAETQRIDANFIVDLSANVRVNRFLTAFGSLNNLTNEEYAVARRPAGIRPGLPRTFLIGIKSTL